MDVSALVQLLWPVSPSLAVRYGRAAPRRTRWCCGCVWRTEYAPFCPDWFWQVATIGGVLNQFRD
jgi:hypothetical protein